MKKFLVVLLAFAMVGAAFAQELKFTGAIRSGASVVIDDNSDHDPALMLWSPSLGHALRFDLTGTYANAEGTAGATFLLRSQLQNLAATVDNVDYGKAPIHTWAETARVWLKAFDKQATFIGGKLDDAGPFGTGMGVDTSQDIGGGLGFHARFEPANTGFAVGMGVFPSARGGVAGAVKLENGRYNFGAAYTIPNTVTIVGLLVDNAKVINAAAGVKVLALASSGITTLGVDFQANNLNEEGGKMSIQIGEKAVFAQGDFEAGARFRQDLKTGDATDLDGYSPTLIFHLYGLYKLSGGTIVPRLDLGFNMGSSRATGTSTVLRTGWDGIGYTNDFSKDSSNLMLLPSVEFRLGASTNQFLQLGYGLFYDLTKDIKDTVGRSMDNLVYLEYRVNF